MTRLRRAIEWLLLLVVAFIAFNVINSHMVYRVGFNFLEYQFRALYVLLILRSLWLVPWPEVCHRWNATQRAALGILAIGCVSILYVMVFINLAEATRAEILSRTAFSGHSDDEIRRILLEYRNYYPATSFIEEVLAKTPEDARIAYFGDQRAHVMSYQLYPRRVYALPALQQELNLTIQEGWDWMKLEDPNHPPMRRWSHDFATNIDPEIQEAIREMIRAKGIRWIMYYDSLHPERSWIEAIP